MVGVLGFVCLMLQCTNRTWYFSLTDNRIGMKLGVCIYDPWWKKMVGVWGLCVKCFTAPPELGITVCQTCAHDLGVLPLQGSSRHPFEIIGVQTFGGGRRLGSSDHLVCIVHFDLVWWAIIFTTIIEKRRSHDNECLLVFILSMNSWQIFCLFHKYWVLKMKWP